ncbi:MAG: ROK family protein [Acidobacteria bacterium]|nr:ROK family protein [Acidobacteriota bacterium]MCA1651121.1 ROK family protein [Acidobacteriota bacterium]
MSVRIGIDLGGTKTEAIALGSGGEERFRRRVDSPRDDYDATIEMIAALVAEAERVAGPATVGVGTPGAISPSSGLIKNANSTWLNGRPLADDLAARLGRTVRLANDANCFTLSESVDGAGAGRHVVFGVIVGTGTGGGIAVDGRTITGVNAIAGEWGHNSLPWPSDDERRVPPCYCGRTGCIETFLSGPGMTRDHLRHYGEALDAQAIAARAAAGDTSAAQTLDLYENRMARALASVINILDPDVIVLGGGLSKIDRLYDRVPKLWEAFVFSDTVSTRLVRAKHGDSSGVRGAAWLWD